MEKGENAGYQHFLLSQQSFLLFPWLTSKLVSHLLSTVCKCSGFARVWDFVVLVKSDNMPSLMVIHEAATIPFIINIGINHYIVDSMDHVGIIIMTFLTPCTTLRIIDMEYRNLELTVLFNSLLHNPIFQRSCARSLLKTLWEKEKMLVTSIFSFFHNVFFPSNTNH